MSSQTYTFSVRIGWQSAFLMMYLRLLIRIGGSPQLVVSEAWGLGGQRWPLMRPGSSIPEYSRQGWVLVLRAASVASFPMTGSSTLIGRKFLDSDLG